MKISLIKSFYGVARAINQLPPDRYNNYTNLRAFLPIAHFFYLQEFRDHIKSHDHKKMLEKVSAMNKCAIDLLRAYIAQQEFRKVCGKQVKVSQRCEMCQLSVYGHLQKHRTSKLHLKLKTFIHPICATCDQEFQNRVEWDEHIVSAKHLALTQKTGDKVWPEYYDPLDVVNMLKLTEVKNPEVTQEVKTDVHESERVREASALALSRVAQYEIAHFDDSKIVGKFYQTLTKSGYRIVVINNFTQQLDIFVTHDLNMKGLCSSYLSSMLENIHKRFAFFLSKISDNDT